MDKSVYSILEDKAVKIARRIGLPSFYNDHKKELDISRSYISSSSLIVKCRSYLNESELHPAHGISHCEKVALESGAVLQAESAVLGYQREDTEQLMLCCQVAGLLHDIKRAEENHTISGSLEAVKILNDFNLDNRYKRYITAAIRNHEAFKEVIESEDEPAKLISDSLYDADKFRWGPDNFTTTLWLMMDATGTPAETLFMVFEEKMAGIRKIKKTFRTATGKKYGPEFIDKGIEIGNEIYMEMEQLIGN